MSKWLLQEEAPFESSLFVTGASRSIATEETYTILMRTIKVLDNRRLFGSADLIVYWVVVDGYPDMESGRPFWTQEFRFFNVKDGATLPIDPENGALIYRGHPQDFLNLYLLVIRDTRASREFAKVLKDNFVAQGVGTVAGALVSIHADLPSVTVPMTRELIVKAVETTLDHFTTRRNLVIGTYYGSLVRRPSDYGLGFHPPNYPTSQLNCGNTLKLAYEVRKERR